MYIDSKKKREIFEYIKKHKEEEFERGKMDCVYFPLKVIELITGWMPGENIELENGRKVNEYSSLAEAYRNLNSKWDGLEDCLSYLMKKRGCEEIKTGFMQFGDVCIIKYTEEPINSIGICIGENVVTMTKDGLKKFNVEVAEKAWRLN